ncbi:hypothetical protein [Sanguibacteroides justesenii]|uniref:Uncharacterized protein n=1 Tax=Sanguibacteroides justesenii TaxID=1547597 RepID=A0AB34R7H5_9PORP|nr:hypothetical protein [Sanguibacteroides justesenii]KIO47141.1 hypothetical protein IE90_00615 [Sanguibacteroides justesenii]
MSGGYFDRSTYAMREIANTIECDIARALKPEPEKIQEDYWTIYEKDSFGSYHSYKDFMSFGSYEDAESFLLRDKTIVKAGQKYADLRFFDDGVIFQSTKRYMSDTPDGEQMPVLYAIHHCHYDHYPYEAEVLELSDETIDAMKEAYRQIRIAEIYATRVDWMISGDDSEESFRERIKEDLAEFEREYAVKDWTYLDENEE